MSNKYDYDVIVIGGGTAGLAAYRKANSLGKKAIIIEKNDFVTTCANVGCMPSKLLIAAAENRHEIEKSFGFGINVGKVQIDEKKLLSRVRAERDRFVGFVKKGANTISEKDRLIGAAWIKDKNTVVVHEKEYTTKTIVVATGSIPFVPDIYKNISDKLLSNENVFEIERLPSKLAVVGAGVIGLELGFAMKNLGVDVTLINTSNKLLGLSENINEYLISHLEKELKLNYKDNVVEAKEIKVNDKDFLELTYQSGKKEVFDAILMAAGRRPNFKSIGLDKVIDNPVGRYNRETTQIEGTNIFLAGDVNNDVPLLHEAAKEGNYAGENAALYPDIKKFKRNTHLSVVFSSPQIMQVGNTRDLPVDVIKGHVSFEDQGRSRVMLKNKGLLNVYFDKKTHKFLGAEMMGPNAENIAHSLSWIIEMGITLEQSLELPFYHPVVEEGIRTALRDAASKLS